MGRRAREGFLLVLAASGLAGCFRESGTGADPAREALPQFAGAPARAWDEARAWGPGNDDVEPIVSPHYVDARAAASFLRDEDEVHLIRGSRSTFVYPEVLLASYHVVNEVIDGEPVAVTSCLMAGSAGCFSRRLDGRVLTFGLSVQLYSGNSVLHDRETGTRWLQMSGEPLRGKLHGRGRLEPRPLERSTWGRIRSERDLRVLAPSRSMEEYRGFYRSIQEEREGPAMLAQRLSPDERLPPLTRGLGVAVQGEARFYPEDLSPPLSIRNDRVGGWTVLVLSGGGEPPRVFRRWLQGRALEFEIREGAIRDRDTGSRWSAQGVCTEGALVGARLDAPAHSRVYWDVWSALYPGTGLP